MVASSDLKTSSSKTCAIERVLGTSSQNPRNKDNRGAQAKMRSRTVWTATLLLLNTLVYSQVTYWVQDRCREGDRRARFNAALANAIEMASRGYNRLSRSSPKPDISTQHDFQYLFKTVISDRDAVQKVLGALVSYMAYTL